METMVFITKDEHLLKQKDLEGLYSRSTQLSEEIYNLSAKSRDGHVVSILEELYTLYDKITEGDFVEQYLVQLERHELKLVLEKRRLDSQKVSTLALLDRLVTHSHHAKTELPNGDLHLLHLESLKGFVEQSLSTLDMSIQRIVDTIENIAIWKSQFRLGEFL